MEFIQYTGYVIVISCSIVALALLNKRFDLGLSVTADEISFGDLNSSDIWGCSMSSSSTTNQQKQLKIKSKEIVELQQRVAVLEKLLTDPSEQLKREINSL